MVIPVGFAQGIAGSRPAVVGNTTDSLPDLKPEQVKDAYYCALVKELAALHPKRLLLDLDPTATYRGFRFDNRAGRAIKEDVPIDKMPFARGWAIKTEKKPQDDMTYLARSEHLPFQKGDVLYLTAWVRAEELPEGTETGTVRFTAILGPPNAGQSAIRLQNTVFAVPEEWKRVHFVMTLPRGLNPYAEELKLQFAFGGAEQTVQIGGIALVQFGAKTKAAAVWKQVAARSKTEGEEKP